MVHPGQACLWRFWLWSSGCQLPEGRRHVQRLRGFGRTFSCRARERTPLGHTGYQRLRGLGGTFRIQQDHASEAADAARSPEPEVKTRCRVQGRRLREAAQIVGEWKKPSVRCSKGKLAPEPPLEAAFAVRSVGAAAVPNMVAP